MLDASVCARCGASRGEVAYSVALGATVCFECFERSAPPPPPSVPASVKLRAPRAVHLPEWVAYRTTVIDAMHRDGCWHYMSADRCAGLCPICDEPLAVRFIGRTPVADFECAGGCDARDVARQLGRALWPA